MTTGERVSTLEHLDELDQLLRDVQAELVPGAEIPDPPPPPPIPEPPPAPPMPEPPPAPPLPELVASLLASMRELLAGYERLLLPPTPPAAQSPVRRPPHSHATVSAGPFLSAQAVRSFETSLSALPGVRDVSVQAYEGTDRAIIDVRLDDASP